MLKHVREKHPEARLPIQNGQNGGQEKQQNTITVEEVDVKNDPGRSMQIEYKDIHSSVSDHQVRVSRVRNTSFIR